MAKVDRTQLEVLARIKAQEPRFVEFLQSRLHSHVGQTIAQQDDVSLRWAQGRAQEATDLLQLLENAADALRTADAKS